VARWWLSRRAIALHLTLAVLVPTFLLLCRWQVERALGGNELSWAYVFEWPFFAAYAVYMWWRLLREDRPSETTSLRSPSPRAPRSSRVGSPPPPGATESAPACRIDHPRADPNAVEEDEELAAYNEYLAQLHADDPPKRWRHRGVPRATG
jgi:hypothetical protein